MAIEGFRAGWRAGVEDASQFTSFAARERRIGGEESAMAAVAERLDRANQTIENSLSQLLARANQISARANQALARGANFFGFRRVAEDRTRAAESNLNDAHQALATAYNGKASNAKENAGFHFKNAWKAASRSADPDIKDRGAKLAFSVASFGVNMKECIKNACCFLADSVKSLGERAKAWLKS